jgi:hypothetical protein
MTRIWLIFFTLLISSCSLRPNSLAYRQQYDYLNTDLSYAPKMHESKYFVVLLVNARHLDYTENRSLLKTIAKHPSDWSKNGDVGHAWIYLKGERNGSPIYLEGGHSGERGILQAKYFEGVMNNIEEGYSNPIKYLWAEQCDGFFQEGNGGHRPTFAAKIDLTPDQFEEILCFVQNYPYEKYAMTGNQCSSFVKRVAKLAGLEIESEVTIQINQRVAIGNVTYKLWEDPRYNMLTFSSPDIIEKSLVEAVNDGRAENALNWYKIMNKFANH